MSVLKTIGLGETVRYNKSSGRAYETLNIKTEKELCWYLYSLYGEGRYVVFGRDSRSPSFFVFWKGEVNKDGFVFEKQDYIKNELKLFSAELDKAESEDDKAFWDTEMSRAKDDLKKDPKKRYGFEGYLLSSGVRGVFHFWNDDRLIKPKSYEYPKKKRKKMEDMSIEELNDF